MLSLPVLKRLAEALVVWANDWDRRDYRQERVDKWLEFAKNRQLRRDHAHIHYLSDRQVLLGDSLEAWLCDLWLLIPVPRGDAELSHGLWCCVYPAGLRRMPVPEHMQGPLVFVGGDAATGAQYVRLAEGVLAEGVPSPEFSCFVPGEVSRFTRSPRAVRWWPLRSQVWPWKRDILPQLCVLALRQHVHGEGVLQWLVSWAQRRKMRPAVRSYFDPAVAHAILHWVVPRGSLKGYLYRVALGLAHEGQPATEIREAAEKHNVSDRTIYRWQKKERDPNPDLQGAALARRAANLARRRKYAEIANYVAEKEGITKAAAWKRIARRRQKGETPEQIVAAMLHRDTRARDR